MPDSSAPRRRRKPIPHGNPLHVIAYTRVSTPPQGKVGKRRGGGDVFIAGTGPEGQRDAITAYCDRHGLTVVGWREEERSGKDLHSRPELLAAIDAVRKGQAGGLIVDKVDRLGRSLHDIAGIAKHAREEGWRLIALDAGAGMSLDTANGAAADLIVHALGMAADFERARISERQRVKFTILRQQGRPRGHRTAPKKLADSIRAKRAKGATWQSIADELNAKKVPGSQGGSQWFPSSVRSVTIARQRELDALALMKKRKTG